ncbi:MAG: DUF445 domain-containing protein [Francisellaceae bacterium]
MINKSLTTNLIALIISLLGIALAEPHIKAIGFYALSGAITNWLAIVMLFDKIPFVYGSGVIPKQFEGFKRAIKKMILSQFFSRANIEKFLSISAIDHTKIGYEIKAAIDYNKLFDAFIEAVMTSSFGGMIESFLGGREALEPMRESFIHKLDGIIDETIAADDFKSKIDDITAHFDADVINSKLEKMIDARLAELTPKMVKDIIQDMIRRHLGWLVVWGGIFGGLIGLIASFF